MQLYIIHTHYRVIVFVVKKRQKNGEGEGEFQRGGKKGRGIHKFLTLSAVHCDVIENKVYFKLFLDQGGMPFVIKFYSVLPDGRRSGCWARFGNSEPVRLTPAENEKKFFGEEIPRARELSKCYQLFCTLI